MKPSRKVKFLKTLMCSYKEAGLRYCFLRSGSLESLAEGDDIDIVLDERKKKLNQKIIQDIADASKVILHKNFEFNDNTVYTLFIRSNDMIEVLNLHFQYNLRLKQISISFNNQIYLHNSDILRGIEYPNDYPVISSKLYAYALTIHAVFDKGYFKEEYKEYIVESIKTIDKDSLYEVFKNHFPGKVNKKLIQYLFNGDFERILENKKNIFNNFSSVKYFALYFINNLRRLASLFRKMHKPKGVFLALLGPDGSGKSTIIQELQNRIEFKRQKVVFLGIRKRHGLLKFLPKVKKVPNHSLAQTENYPSSFESKKKLRSLFRTVYHLISYSLFYYFKIFPYLVKGYIVFGDRYFYDLLVLKDAHMSRSLKKAFLIAMPSPNFSVLLKMDPKIIHTRKSELSVNEISRQLTEFEALGRIHHKPKIKVFKNLAIDSTSNEVLEVLWKELTNKYKSQK